MNLSGFQDDVKLIFFQTQTVYVSCREITALHIPPSSYATLVHKMATAKVRIQLRTRLLVQQ